MGRFGFIAGLAAISAVLCSCGVMDVQSNHGANSNGALAPQVRDVSFYARANGDLRKKVIVLPFLDGDIHHPQAIKMVARRTVVDDLVGTNQFIVINNGDIPQDLHSFIKNNDYDMPAIAKVAANLGASAVIVGRVLDINAQRSGDPIGVFRTLRARTTVNVEIRVFSATTGKPMLDVTKRASVESDMTRVADNSNDDIHVEDDPNLVRIAVRRAFHQTVGEIVRAVEKLSWEGRIALVSGDKIYLNAGRLSGLQIGDILRVSETGRDIFDPDTGVYIGTAPGRMKGTLEIVSYFGKDGAIAIVHSGSGFKENDQVEMY